MGKDKFLCASCGAEQEYKPGTTAIVCPFCGHKNEIEQQEIDLTEHDINAFLENAQESAASVEAMTVKCPSCQAESTLPENITDASCPFCGTQIQDKAKKNKLIKVDAVAPFQIDKRKAMGKFRTWLQKLWFAPNKLKKYARVDGGIKGVYIPYWTYDSDTYSQYTGQRGEHYYVNETYTDTDSQGNSVTKTRQVQKTRWYPAAGSVSHSFDDVLILASNSLPRNKTEALEPWDLRYLVEYKEDYISGFSTEAYQVSLAEGFGQAQGVMDNHIRHLVRRDIGGDEQRIHSVDTQHNNVTFKHVLLPIWINSYEYQDKIYRFLVNGLTGEVQGERPWSAWKIAFAVLAGLGIAALGFWLYTIFKGN